jgi:hypothetical protein
MYLLRSSGNAKIPQTVNKFPILCGNRKFITMFTTPGPVLTNWSVFEESTWNVMAHGDARVEKWSGNWQMKSVPSILHTTSEYGVSSITTADSHTSGKGGKGGQCVGLTTLHPSGAESWNLAASTSWKLKGLSRPVMGLLYLYPLPITKLHTSTPKSSEVFK